MHVTEEGSRDFLKYTGEKVADWFSVCIEQKHGYSGSVGFDPDVDLLQAVTVLYFAKVKEFCARHRFSSDEMINESKSAALLFKALYEGRAQSLFRLQPELQGSIYEKLVPVYFFYFVALSTLMIKAQSIDQSLEDEVLQCIFRGVHVSDEWLICALHLLQELGDKQKTP